MDKKVAIMQPYFLPYMGYFHLLNSVDEFVIYDNIQYTKKGWINRNRILVNGKDKLISLPLKKDSDYLNVIDRKLSDNWNVEKVKLLNLIKSSYKKSPQYSIIFPIIEKCINLLNVKALISIRCNLTLNYEKQYKCSWHKDQEYDCKTAILYLNTCNGYTEFKDKSKKIKSEENKIVIFDTKNTHRLVNQTDSKRRIVINFNYFD